MNARVRSGRLSEMQDAIVSASVRLARFNTPDRFEAEAIRKALDGLEVARQHIVVAAQIANAGAIAEETQKEHLIAQLQASLEQRGYAEVGRG